MMKDKNEMKRLDEEVLEKVNGGVLDIHEIVNAQRKREEEAKKTSGGATSRW